MGEIYVRVSLWFLPIDAYNLNVLSRSVSPTMQRTGGVLEMVIKSNKVASETLTAIIMWRPKLRRRRGSNFKASTPVDSSGKLHRDVTST